MPNGKPGDNPYTDVVVHGLDVYSPRIDELIREIDALGDVATRHGLRDRLFSEHNVYEEPDLVKLEAELIELRRRLTARPEARSKRRAEE